MDPAAIRAHEKDRWNFVAAGWKTWWEVIEGWSQPVSDRLVEMAGVGPGDAVLDIATGAGEPALTAARQVGPAGSVVATDLSSAMMRLAAERAAADGLDNIEFREAGAETLSLPGATFNAALCRWGLMFMPKPVAALERAHAHLRPGGRLAVSAWGAPEEVPMISVGRTIFSSLLPPPLDPDIGPFRFAEAGTLEGLLAAAGLDDIKSEPITVTVEFPGVADFISYRQEVSTQDLALRQNHPPEKVAETWAAVAKEAAAYAGPDGRVVVENRALIASGQRAS